MAHRDPWRRRWLAVTAVCAAAATLVDIALLERKRAYFTGGFLSTDFIRSVPEGVVFVAGSWMGDAAVIGVPVALVLWLFRRWGLPRALATAFAAALGLGPLIFANIISYQILSYLGDAFDFGLMFDLVGRDPEEILAVSSDHLAVWAGLIVSAAVVAAGIVWQLRRMARRRRAYAEWVPFVRWMVAPVALLLVGGATVATMRATSDVFDNGLRRKPSGQVVGTVVSFLTDVDRDGFGLLDRPADPKIFDARVYPWATEIPGNGIDENGVGGDLPPGGSLPPGPPAVAGRFAWTPDVILIMLETLRADAVGSSLDGHKVTPVLDALARTGVSSALAFSHNGYTAQSRHSLFTGSLLPTGGRPSLLDDFKANGYETAYFSGQDESFGGAALSSGFERADLAYDARQDVERRYTNYTTAGSLGVSHRVLNERAQQFLERRDPSRPLFVYAGFYDAHFPYHHKELEPILGTDVLGQFDIGPSRAEALRRMYLNSVANADRAVGVLVENVRRTTGRTPAVIVLADHGESLFDEGFLGHGYALNDVQTRIPLVAANLPIVIEEPFGQADVRPAILKALTQPPGESRTPILRPSPEKKLFQYLGLIERPAEIGFNTLKGRTIYDFRSNKVRLPDGPWRAPADLDEDERAAFLDLVHTWERMIGGR